MSPFVLKLSQAPIELKALERALDSLVDVAESFPTDEEIEKATLEANKLMCESVAPLSGEVGDAQAKEHYRLINKAKAEMATAPTWGRVYVLHEPNLDAHLEAVAGLIEALGAVKLAKEYRWFNSEQHKTLKREAREGSKKELFAHPKEHGYNAWKTAIIACVRVTRLSLISPAKALGIASKAEGALVTERKESLGANLKKKTQPQKLRDYVRDKGEPVTYQELKEKAGISCPSRTLKSALTEFPGDLKKYNNGKYIEIHFVP